MWSINDVAARDMPKTQLGKFPTKTQTIGISSALIIVEGQEIPLILSIIAETCFGGFLVDARQLHC